MKKLLLSLIVILFGFGVFAQDYFPKNDGVKASNTNYTAFINATIHTSEKTTCTSLNSVDLVN